MYFVADRKGNIRQEDSLQDRFLGWMYTHVSGRMILKLLVRPSVSRFAGRILDGKISRVLIPPFIRSHHLQMTDYKKKNYTSYNDFFTRELAEGARRIDFVPESFVSPCDGRLSVYEVDGGSRFFIKHTQYTLPELLKNRRLADKYAGGYLWVFRLCVEDYHRYIYVDYGKESVRRRIPGILHTVNPAAGDQVPIYKENTREYSLLKSDHFGMVLQMEVGAMLVGRIENRQEGKWVQRGQEKGNFAFGGSTVILATQKGRVMPDRDIVENSKRGAETKVRLGERVGYAEKPALTKSESLHIIKNTQRGNTSADQP